MRRVASILVVGLAACGSDQPACGTNIAEDLFVVAAIDAYGGTIGPSGSGSTCPGGGMATVTGTTCKAPHLAQDCAIDFAVTGTSSQVVASYEGSVCGFTFP